MRTTAELARLLRVAGHDSLQRDAADRLEQLADERDRAIDGAADLAHAVEQLILAYDAERQVRQQLAKQVDRWCSNFPSYVTDDDRVALAASADLDRPTCKTCGGERVLLVESNIETADFARPCPDCTPERPMGGSGD